MKDVIVSTNNLSKKYGNFYALDNVSININKGDIYGLIGRNGAGKTTLMKVITTLTSKTSGEFSLFGYRDDDLSNVKRRIGALIENAAFFPGMNAYDNLKYYAIQRGIVDLKQIDEALTLVGLGDAGKKKFKNFSLGMKQRLGVALAILDNPDFIILDEPINGLDPIGISELRDVFTKLNEERGITILISSHILSELYQVVTKFCIIDKGSVIKELAKEELDRDCSKCIVIKVDNTRKASSILEEKLHTTNYKVIDKREIRLYDYLDEPEKVNKALLKNDVDVISINETGISFEDYFKKVIKEGK